MSRPSSPVVKKTLHDEGVRTVRFAGTFSESVIATAGRPNYGVKVRFSWLLEFFYFYFSFLQGNKSS